MPTIKCRQCGKEFRGRAGRKFCSHSCAASYNNTGINRHGYVPARCRKCGRPTAPRRVYCPACIAEGIHLVRNHETDVSKIRWPTMRRKLLLKLRSLRCERRGITEWLGPPVPLSQHHIDGDSENNDPLNLLLLCANCHALTPNYCSKNIGHGKRS